MGQTLRALVGGDRVQSNKAQSHVLTAVLLHLSTGSSSVKKYSILLTLKKCF